MDIDEYDRRYVNVKTLLFCDANRDELLAVLEDARINDVTYLVYQDEESNPEAVLVPWGRYNELLSSEHARLT